MKAEEFFTTKESPIEKDIEKQILRLFKGKVLSKKEIQYLPKQVQNI